MDTKNLLAWIPRFRVSLVIAAVIALIGFFSLHFYAPVLGVVGNAMNGTIVLTYDCPVHIPIEPLDFGAGDKPDPLFCGLSFRYRWLLIGLILFVAGCWWSEKERRSNS